MNDFFLAHQKFWFFLCQFVSCPEKHCSNQLEFQKITRSYPDFNQKLLCCGLDGDGCPFNFKFKALNFTFHCGHIKAHQSKFPVDLCLLCYQKMIAKAWIEKSRSQLTKYNTKQMRFFVHVDRCGNETFTSVEILNEKTEQE